MAMVSGAIAITSHFIFSCSESLPMACLGASNFLLPNPTPFFLTTTNRISLGVGGTSTNHSLVRLSAARTKATPDETDPSASSSFFVQEDQSHKEIKESVKLLKTAAKTRKVAAEEILPALSFIENAKLDPSGFPEILGGKESPGRTWMLVFTAEKQLKRGRYFPLTAVQRFDTAAKRIENGVYLGPIGCLTFEGRFSWKKKILAFIFEYIRIKVGPLNPLQISLGKREDREPSTKDPFFIWFYVDEEIAVAQGRSGGTAFWCRCHRVNT